MHWKITLRSGGCECRVVLVTLPDYFSVLETLAYTLIRGFAIGVIISAPMGPVGILCIQRTLNSGRKAGFYTGIGAALSDIFYCLITGFGLSLIEDFLERNQSVISLIGSFVLVAFGIYMLRKKTPDRPVKSSVLPSVSPHKNILAGFLFTFSNPLILFLIIGLFARFNFLLPELHWYHIVIGYLMIAAGAVTWWYAITYFVDKVRTRFSLRSIMIINKIIGIAVLVFAVVGIVTATISLTQS